MKYNLLSLMTPISLIGIAFLVYSLGTSIVFISFNQQLQLSYLIALICFMPIGFMLIPHTLSLKYGLYSKETDVVFHWQSYLCLALLIFLVNHYCVIVIRYFTSSKLSYDRQSTHQNPTGYSIFNFGDKIWFGVRYRWTLDLQSLSINYLI